MQSGPSARSPGSSNGGRAPPVLSTDSMTSANPPSTPKQPAMPEAIGGFRLLEKLGSGSMGMVYKATQVSMARTVALKVIPAQLAMNAFFTKRFVAEAHAAGKLVDPHVVKCYDVGQADGYWYMALEFVGGGDAARLAKGNGGALSEARALEIIRDCASGLKAIQQAGLVHRDIKPANILLTDKGLAKLGDLGLARGRGEEEGVIAHGGTVGTPAYISPEQAGGADLDIRSDIYSLCATLYKLVTGHAPFSGATVWDVVAKVINERVPDPRSVAPAISARTAAIILTGTSKDALHRYQDPLELKSDIELVLEGKDPAVAMKLAASSVRAPRAARAADQPRQAARAVAGSVPAAGRTPRREESPPRRRLPRWVRRLAWGIGSAVVAGALGLLMLMLIGSRQKVEEAAARHNEARAQFEKEAASIALAKPEAETAMAVKAPKPPSPAAAGVAKPQGSDQPDAEIERIAAARMAMRPEEQIAQVVADLRRLNSDYDGKIDFTASDGQVTELSLSTLAISRISPLATLKKLRVLSLRGERPDNKGNLDNLAPIRFLQLNTLDVSNNTILDLSPIASLPLSTLICQSNIIKKLTPLHGMKIRRLDLADNIIADLTPLGGMPLESLNLSGNQIHDLSALSGLPLTVLDISRTAVQDLTPLKGMPLAQVSLIACEVSDVSVLAGSPLKQVLLTPEGITSGLKELRAHATISHIDDHWSEQLDTAPEFWKRLDAGEFTGQAIGDQPIDAPKGQNVLANGSFDSRIGKRQVGWILGPGARVEQEHGQHFLRLTAAAPRAGIMSSRWLMLKPSWTTLTISVRMRASGLTIGKQQDSCARLLLWYSSKSGERIGPWPDMPEIGWCMSARQPSHPEPTGS